MNKVKCEMCEHNNVCKYKIKYKDIEKMYDDFNTGIVVHPFELILNCTEFSGTKLTPRAPFQFEPFYYGTGTPYPNQPTYTTHNTKEGLDE